ncbi:MAG: amino acid adenylation domain-containing protein [Candidatus Omnitrophota bacterium]
MAVDIHTLALYNTCEDYWLKTLNGVTLTPIFGDQSNNGISTRDSWRVAFPPGLSDSIHSMVRGEDTNAFLIFLTAFNILIYKYTHADDILIHTPDFRDEESKNSEDAMLFFRTHPGEDQIIRDLLNQFLSELNGAYENHQFLYESLLRRFNDNQNGDVNALSAFGLRYNRFNLESLRMEASHLFFSIEQRDHGIDLLIHYHTCSYTSDQIAQLARHYIHILASMVSNLDTPLHAIGIFSPEDKQKLMEFIGEEIEAPEEGKTFLARFERQVEDSPQSPALACGPVTLSYRALNERANQLARRLRHEAPLANDDSVALVMDRSPKMVESILAVWKCGAAYIPIDPSYPQERIDTIINDSGAKLMIRETGNISFKVEQTLKPATRVIYLDQIENDRLHEDKTNLCVPRHPGDLAYIIYTSGSTGKPKGVMIEQRGMMNHLHAKISEIQIDATSVIAQNASHCFDISVWQFFAALLVGGKTIIYSDQAVLNPTAFTRQLAEDGVNILEVVPSYLSVILDLIEDQQTGDALAGCRCLLVTGESVKPGLVNRWFKTFPGIRMVNAYGPTEASDDITHFVMDRFPGTGNIPIGKTLRNFRIYIVNSRMELCPVGVKGEILVSGLGVGRGYLNDIKKTTDAFMEDPFRPERGFRLYKTGDIGRYLPDGNIEFFGRKDYQVKVRGYRIELEEIENKLSRLDGIRDAAVVEKDSKNKGDGMYLCAYITLRDGVRTRTEEIKTELARTLPHYMIPAFIVVLDALPLTPNGKLDRKALPDPDESGIGDVAYVAPRNAIEIKLAEIWRQVIGVEQIGIHDNFFALGGNSLLGIRIVNKIQEWLHETVHVTILFLAPTIEQLAVKLESYRQEKETRINEADIAELRSLMPPLPPLPSHLVRPGKTPPVLFILCPPRSGSTLLRVILAGHPGLFAPQELQLLSFNTLTERKAALSGTYSLYLEGVIRAIMEMKAIGADQAKQIMEAFEAQGMTVQEFYGILQHWLGETMLVEKTPQYAYDINVLQRAEAYFDSALYIHLVRNPYAVIHSYENARLDQLFEYPHRFSTRELAELLWVICNQNILQFLETIPAGRKYRMEYEELVGNPESVVSRMCEHFGLEFDRGMLDVYDDAGHRMTDGIYAESKMLGDVKFFSHTSIDTTSVEKWKEKYTTEFLGQTAVDLAKYFGYLRGRHEYPTIEPAPEKEYYELSPAQRRLWLLDRLVENQIAYNMPGAYWVEGNLHIDVLEKSYAAAIKRHEILRTTFVSVEGPPRQKIHAFEAMGYRLDYLDLRTDPGREETAAYLIREEAAKPFNLEQGPLIRTRLIHMDANRYIFLFNMHHIISDGWSMHGLMKEIIAYYDAYATNSAESLEPLRLQYKDYSEWMTRESTQRVLQQQEKYWLDQFAEDIPVLSLPTDYARPAIMSFEGHTVNFDFTAQETGELTKVARSEGVTLFILLISIFNVFLSKVSGEEDIIIGTPVAGRNHPDLEHILGMFVNTLALRNYPRGEMTFIRFLHHLKTLMLEAFENQDYPFETLVEKLEITRDTSRNPLFDVMFTIQDIYESDRGLNQFSDLKIKPYAFDHRISKFDLLLATFETDGRVCFVFEYCTALFREGTIQRFIQYVKAIARSIIQDPAIRISDMEIITPEEKRQIISDFNRTQAAYPSDKTIEMLFEDQVKKTPDCIAVIGSTVSLPKPVETLCTAFLHLTYKELNERSDRLAYELIQKGVEPDAIVGIKIERSIQMIIGIFAILKAGGAYLPIDPDYPQERIEYMLKDSQAHLLVTHCLGAAPCIGPGVINPELPSVPAVSAVREKSNLAYVIYTSGSTGMPKGVVVKREGFLNLLYWYINEFNINPNDNVLLIASVSFDLAQKNVFSSFMVGGCLTLASPGLPDYSTLSKLIQKAPITLINCAPSVFYPLVEFNRNSGFTDLNTLRWVILGGEPILIEKLLPWMDSESYRCQIANTYGPTECTDIASCYRIPNEKIRDLKSIPIGKPVSNVAVYILGKYREILPVGVVGELYIGGIGVSQGYYNNRQLTEEKFLELSHLPESKIYRTGDMGRWLDDGNIEFLGRVDDQVKINGMRIELGEIEHVLLSHNEIKDAVVIVHKKEKTDYYLCAYIISHKNLSIADIQEYLSYRLPQYMIPTHFIQLEHIPLTPSGKVDKRSLPDPEMGSTRSYIAPENAVEKEMVKIWAEVLGMAKDRISMDDNFFQLGGHSIKASLLVSQIRKAFDVNISLSDIFRISTVRGLSHQIKGSVKEKYLSIPPAEKKEYYELSSAQRRLYILHQMDEKGINYNISSVFLLEGEIDKDRFEGTFRQLIDRHESLRTSFPMVGNEPMQRIHDDVEFEINYLATEFTGDTEGEGKKVSGIENFIKFFDLSKAPLMRVELMRVDDNTHLLAVGMHHIISDGTSMNIVVQDFMAFYKGEELPEVQIQYRDFSEWQKRENQKELRKQQEAFWLNEFEGEIPVLDLPADFLRPSIQSFEGRRVQFELDKETTGLLKALALETGATLYMMLLALYNVFLSKICNQEDIVIGSPIAGRSHSDLEKVVGMFVNTLALRNYPIGEKVFTDFLEEVKGNILRDFENQEYPYEELVERVLVNRDTGRNPLFDTMFVLQNADMQSLAIPGLVLTPYEYENHVSKFDLTLSAIEKEDRLCFTFEYSTKLFKRETIERFISYFKNIVNGVIENRARTLSNFEIITEEEKNHLLYDFNHTEVEYTKDKTIQQLFEERACRGWDRIALVGAISGIGAASGVCPQLSYAELNERSNRFAYELIQKGVGPDVIVGIKIERSIEMIIGILGVLKAGGAYLPIDPGLPQERVDYMLNDSRAKFIFLTEHTGDTGGSGVEVETLRSWEVKKAVFLDPFNLSVCPAGAHTGAPLRNSESISLLDQLNLSSSQPLNFFPSSVPPVSSVRNHSNLAYIIYTSGSTGKPKGVFIRHSNICPLLHWGYEHLALTSDDRSVQNLSYYFDWSVWEIFIALTSGAGLHMVSNELIMDGVSYADYMNRYGITVLHITPTHFQALIFSGKRLPSLRHLCFGAEKLAHDLVEKSIEVIEPQCRIYNMYGPTEATIMAAVLTIDRSRLPFYSQLSGVPIGENLGNNVLFILDRSFNLCPIHIFGELYIGGDGVSPGYLNNPELTVKRFISVTSVRSVRDKLYKTGDLCRWLDDGTIEFLHRMDEQVKIRGFRIELGEIESRLLTCDHIKEAVVIVREKTSGDKYLAAYVVSDIELSESELNDYLLKTLPDYMVPSSFTQLEKIPLNPNGKLDRKALPEPEWKGETGYAAPQNATQVKLVEIWSDILNVEENSIGIDTNFFQLGGHSLKAVLLLSKIHQALSVKLPFIQLFKTPTIRELSSYIKGMTKAKAEVIEPVEQKEYYRLSSAQKRIFFMQQLDPASTTYNIPQANLIRGQLDLVLLDSTFYRLLQRHESLRTSFEMIHEEPAQRIHPDVRFNIEYSTGKPGLGSPGTGEPVEDFTPYLEGFVKPFDLSQAPLIRVKVVEIERFTHILLIDVHHIVTDGVSNGILLRDFDFLYRNKGAELPELRIQYKEYAEWQGRKDQRQRLTQQENYWLHQLGHGIPVLDIPTDYPRPTPRSLKGDAIRWDIDETLSARIRAFVSDVGCTLNIFFLAVHQVLLAKYSNQEDIIVGTVSAGRRHADLEHTVGMFINMLAIRNQPYKEKVFKDFLLEVKQRSIDAYENQDYQFDDLVLKLGLQRAQDRTPIFETVFVVQNLEMGHSLKQDGLTASEEISVLEIPRSQLESQYYDLIFQAEERPDVIKMVLLYATALFKRSTAEWIQKHFMDILAQVVKQPDLKLMDIEITQQFLKADSNVIKDQPSDFRF